MFDFMSVVVVACEGLGELVSLQSAGEERTIFLLSFTCNYMLSVRRGFFFFLVLEMGTPCGFHIIIL